MHNPAFKELKTVEWLKCSDIVAVGGIVIIINNTAVSSFHADLHWSLQEES